MNACGLLGGLVIITLTSALDLACYTACNSAAQYNFCNAVVVRPVAPLLLMTRACGTAMAAAFSLLGVHSVSSQLWLCNLHFGISLVLWSP